MFVDIMKLMNNKHNVEKLQIPKTNTFLMTETIRLLKSFFFFDEIMAPTHKKFELYVYALRFFYRFVQVSNI